MYHLRRFANGFRFTVFFTTINKNTHTLRVLHASQDMVSHEMGYEPPISFDGPQKLVGLTGLGLHVVRKMV